MADGFDTKWGVVRLTGARRGHKGDRQSAECGLNLWGRRLSESEVAVAVFSSFAPRPGPGTSRPGPRTFSLPFSRPGPRSRWWYWWRSPLFIRGVGVGFGNRGRESKGNTITAEDRNRATRGLYHRSSVHTSQPQGTSEAFICTPKPLFSSSARRTSRITSLS